MYPRRALVLAFAAALVLAAPGAPVAQELPTRRAPVPLHVPPVTVSPYSELSTISCRVSVGLEVDAAGRVARVEVRQIEPATGHDDEIRELVASQLARWRFAPATDESGPRPASLAWTIELRALGSSPHKGPEREETEEEWTVRIPLDPDDNPAFGELVESSVEWRIVTARRMRSVPDTMRSRLVERALRAAREKMGGGQVRTFETERFLVLTDLEDPAAPRKLATNFEAIYASVYADLEDALPAYAARGKLPAIVFATRQEFVRFRENQGPAGRAEGFYSPVGYLAFHAQVPDPATALSLQIHETTHALVDRHLVSGAVELPVWLSEGLAEYYGQSEVRRGRLVPGKRRKGRVFALGIGHDAWVVENQSAIGPRELRRRIRDGSLPTVGTLLATSRETFYGDDPGVHYAMSWLLVHFLKHGLGEDPDAKFRRFLLYVFEGFPVQRTLEQVYGVSIASLDEPFREYVRKF
ncbi:MAG: hypothetical protein D6738_09965 [Acidobacteria bacterium]|nr:MAG: hypothetical protein D6738_09965 [Acidobacteriota bacterium]